MPQPHASQPRLILASRSPRRRALLKAAAKAPTKAAAKPKAPAKAAAKPKAPAKAAAKAPANASRGGPAGASVPEPLDAVRPLLKVRQARQFTTKLVTKAELDAIMFASSRASWDTRPILDNQLRAPRAGILHILGVNGPAYHPTAHLNLFALVQWATDGLSSDLNWQG